MAETFQRATPAAGSVIARKIGEEVRFVDLSNWQNVDLHQDLLGGDVLRTNATGQLAILFADHTQVRLGRNSSLQVRQMSTTGDTILNLQTGTMWARAQRGGQGLTVETPAAAAAIRGTDWTLTVKGDKTSLIVLEGRVELKNEHGSVEVSQGEAAVATIGQAPRKLVIVTPDDREQMLFYLTLRGGFTFMPASPLSVQKMRSERQRIDAKLPEGRSGEDWLVLAEVQLSFDGRQKARQSLDKARTFKLSASQRARADLIEALIAGAEKRYQDAAGLFARAEPRLDAERRSIAAYGGYYSRSLIDPNHAEKPPATITGPYAAVMKAYTAGFLEDIPAAIETMKQAEARYPTDSTLPALRAMLALLINDRVQMKEAIDRSLAIDPSDPNALQARARMRADYESDLEGALDDLNHAIAQAPGSSMAWNDLGLLQDARGAHREAEAALKTSIELDPDDPVGHANLAILYLDQSRMKEAKREIDAALAADPSFDIALLARGRYYLQTGEVDKAVDDLLAASTANPSYSQAHLMLAAGHYEHGDREPSNQALDNADRLDKNDPVISSFRTALAIDDYDSVGAIKYAQEFLRRSRARGGHYGSLGANQNAGSTLNNAFRLQGLNAWGQYYGDAVFDPFAGSSYIDQVVGGSANPFSNSFLSGSNAIDYASNGTTFSSFIQGLLFDPHMLSGRSRSANLLRTPFLEGSVGGGLIHSGSKNYGTGEAEIQGFSNEPFPISGYANVSYDKTPVFGEFGSGLGDFSGDLKILSGNAYLTATPTPDNRFVLYGNSTDYKLGLGSNVPPFRLDRDDEAKVATAGLGWSHTLGYQDVVNTALFYSNAKSDITQSLTLPPFPGSLDQIGHSSQKAYIAAINHTVGDDDLSWRYGIEGGVVDVFASQQITPAPSVTLIDEPIGIGRAYVDLLHEIRPNLKAEYALFGTLLDGDTIDQHRLEPRLGIAWAPMDGQWLRAAALRQSYDFGTPTLSPVSVVGIQPNRYFIGVDGYADTLALRWDAQWTDWLFTSVDYQHQEMHDVSLAYPVTAFVLAPLSIDEGRIDRVSVTSNIAFGAGFGLVTSLAYADSEDRDPASPGFGQSLVFVPETAGQVALTWVNEANVKATIAANYTGKRLGDPAGTELDSYWTLDANLIWEPFDKRFAVELAGFNLLDEDFDVATNVPGWGRVVKGTFKVRF
jgi:tetratricopeptide (TPR) repeat protein